jgi:N-acylneuraminate cytidylyltransferase
MKNTLVIIPARSGSKGIKNKNIKLLNGIPLIEYSLNFALKYFSKSRICISTDSQKIINLLSKKIDIPFIRPDHLSNDYASMSDVISHAASFYRKIIKFDKILLLQPTSPIREEIDLLKMYDCFEKSVDMVISVCESKISPEFNLYKDTGNEFIEKLSNRSITRRQDSKKYYYANGSMYLINAVNDKIDLSKLKTIKKIVMDPLRSIDIDDDFDWEIAKMIIKKNE